jgi:hypothetical protein
MKRHYPIMRMRYFRLAILAATAATTFSQNAPESAENNSNDMTRQLVGDWDIQPEDGYPIIGFDDTNEENEVVFKYNFTGTPNNRKFLDVNLYQNDCVSASDDSLAFINSTSGDELDINIDVIQETIANSVHYQDINGASATIDSACAWTTTTLTTTDSSSPSTFTRQMSPSTWTSPPALL